MLPALSKPERRRRGEERVTKMDSRSATFTSINYTLASVAMLNSVFNVTNRDLLDSLTPFVKTAIYKTTKIGDEVRLDTVTSYLNTTFGFTTIPLSVTRTLFNRLSPTYLIKRFNTFYLEAGLEADIARFAKNENKYKQHCEQVGNDLASYLRDCTGNLNVDSAQALDYLLFFFESHGFSLAKSPKSIAFLPSNKKKSYEYQVGQFILDEMEKESSTFGFILEMLQGFFLSLAISLHTQSGGNGKERFKQTCCYLDIRIILDALRCNAKESNEASLELIKMLKEQGAKVCVFEHTLDEVDEILHAYEYSIRNPNSNQRGHTLEGFDSNHVSWKDVRLFRNTVQLKVSNLGITVVKKEHYDESHPPVIDEAGLHDYLDQNISYSRPIALDRDVDSISTIATLRRQLVPKSIESCEHIFITHNTRLAHFAEQYLHGDNNLQRIPYIIGEPQFTALLWLKCYQTHTNYSRIKLIQDALSSTAVTEEIMQAFFHQVELMEKNGGITEAEADAMKAHMFNMRELMSLTNGDSEQVDSNTVLSIRNRLKEQYDTSTRAAISAKNKALEQFAHEQEEERSRAFDEITRVQAETKAKYERGLSIFAGFIFIPLCIVAVTLSICDIFSNETITPRTAFLAVFAGAGALDLFVSKRGIIKRCISRIARTISDRKADKKRSEYRRIFGEFN